MKGIVLAGGLGSRLHPLTNVISKQILPIYDKPLIYYPISVLLLAGIRDIAIISSPRDINLFKDLLGTGDDFGVKFEYLLQDNPGGIAQSFLVAEKFIGNDDSCLILGDNIFFGYNFSTLLTNASQKLNGASIFLTRVNNPSEFGIAEVLENGLVASIEEKPVNPKSNMAVTGLYFYDNQVVDIAKSIKPSSRGELEITDVNKVYLEQSLLNAYQLGRGFAWLDTGTHDSLLSAGDFVQTIEKRQGQKIACLEEISYNKGWIDNNQLKNQAKKYSNSPYGDYLNSLLKEKS